MDNVDCPGLLPSLRPLLIGVGALGFVISTAHGAVVTSWRISHGIATLVGALAVVDALRTGAAVVFYAVELVPNATGSLAHSTAFWAGSAANASSIWLLAVLALFAVCISRSSHVTSFTSGSWTARRANIAVATTIAILCLLFIIEVALTHADISTDLPQLLVGRALPVVFTLPLLVLLFVPPKRHIETGVELAASGESLPTMDGGPATHIEAKDAQYIEDAFRRVATALVLLGMAVELPLVIVSLVLRFANEPSCTAHTASQFFVLVSYARAIPPPFLAMAFSEGYRSTARRIFCPCVPESGYEAVTTPTHDLIQ